jgi:hypothetical protein
MKKKDLFISHASEDKIDFVRPLAKLLKEYGLNVWYDEFELKIGSSLSASVNKGIKESKFGLIILSKSFFTKSWTNYELKSFTSLEIDNDETILPIWKDVNRKEVVEFSPYLADKVALNSAEGIDSLALKIIDRCDPDLFSKIHLKLEIERAYKEGKMVKADLKELKPGPIRHLHLSEPTMTRIRLIRTSLWSCIPHSMEYWIEGFRRDVNIEKEISYWEGISTAYLEIIQNPIFKDEYLGKEENFYKNVFALLLNPDNSKHRKFFSPKFIDEAISSLLSQYPVYDMDDQNPFEE